MNNENDEIKRKLREKESELSNLIRIKEELIRYCSQNVCDKEFLKSTLTNEEIHNLSLL